MFNFEIKKTIITEQKKTTGNCRKPVNYSQALRVHTIYIFFKGGIIIQLRRVYCCYCRNNFTSEEQFSLLKKNVLRSNKG